MQVVVLSNEGLKEELLAQGLQQEVQLHWLEEPGQLLDYPQADAWFDLLFENTDERIAILKQLTDRPVFINAATTTLHNMPGNFIRINAWPTFLKRPTVEATVADAAMKEKAAGILAAFQKNTEWVADVPGFIAARVVSMIINEAYFSLAEEVSSKQATDTAMKLGTNYPYGPFEWAEKIGLKRIAGLLAVLSKEHSRYQPASLLLKEADL